MGKPYDDPKELARLYKAEDMSYAEMAEELGCSAGTISIRMNRYEEEIEEYDASDFQAEKHVEELAELESDEVYEVLREYLFDKFEAPTDEIGDLYVEPLYLAIYITGIEVGDAIDAAYSSGVKNPCIAVSEHHYSDALQERMNGEAIGLLVVTEDNVRVESECELTLGSGVRSLFDRDYGPAISYQHAAWLQYQVASGKDATEIAHEAQLLPKSIETKMDEYDINA